MDTTIDQQVAMDKALLLTAQRLRIGRSNFCLLSDIKSKESTLQLVYDVLRICPFFKAFLVTADVPKIFEHKNQKKSNEMYYPRFTKVIIHHFMLKDPSIPRRNKVNWQNSKAYKEYYVIATGEAVPKPNASVRRTRSSFDTSITPPTAATSPRLTASAKGKQTAKTHIPQPSGSGANEGIGSKPGVLDVPTDESEEELSWNSIDDEGDDNEEKDDDGDEEDQGLIIGEEGRHVEEEEEGELYRGININQGRGIQTNLEVEDPHVTLTPVNPDGVESIFTTTSSPIVSLELPTLIMTPSTIATITTSGEAPIPPPIIPSIILENLPTFNSAFRFEERLRSLETSISEFRQTNQFADAVSAIPGIVHQYMD
nr:hypothetical protein [Tanacetum cinerariifolium]